MRLGLKPLGSVLFSNESAGFGNASGFHGLAVPVKISLQFEGDDTGQTDLDEVPANLERCEGLAFVEDRIGPFLKMTPHAREALRHFFRLGMFGVAGEFLVAFQLHVTL